MSFIGMCCYDKCVLSFCERHSKFISDFICFLWCNFSRLKSYSDTNMKTISILLIRIFDEHLTPFSYEQFLKLTGGHYHIRDSRDLMHEVCNSTNSTPDEQVKKSGSAGTVPRV